MPADIRQVYRIATGEAIRDVSALRKAIADSMKETEGATSKAVQGYTSLEAAIRKAGGVTQGAFGAQSKELLAGITQLRQAGVSSGPVFDALRGNIVKLGAAAEASGVQISSRFAWALSSAKKASADQKLASEQLALAVRAEAAQVSAAKRLETEATNAAARAASTAAKQEAQAAASITSLEKQRSAAYKQMLRDQDAATKENERRDKASRGGGGGFGGLGTAASALGIGVGAFAIGNAIREGVAAAVEFDTAMANVNKTVDATPAEIATLREGFRGMALQIPQSASELANLGAIAGQFGVKKQDILGFTRTIADLGVAVDGISAENAAASLAQIGNITHSSTDQIQRMASVLVELGNNGASTEGQILDLAARVAAAGDTVGLTRDQIFGLSAAMANLGIEAESGGTALSKTLNSIGGAVATGSAKLGEFARISGMTSEEFVKAWKTKPAEALQAFLAGLDRVKLASGSAAAALGSVGISSSRQVDVLTRLAAATRTAADGTTALSTTLRQASEEYVRNTALTVEAEKKYGSIANQWKLLKNAAADLALGGFEVIRPAVAAALQVGVFYLQHLKDFTPIAVAARIAIAELGAALHLLGGVTGKEFNEFLATTKTELDAQQGRFDRYSNAVKAAGVSFQDLTAIVRQYKRDGEDANDMNDRMRILLRAASDGSQEAARFMEAFRKNVSAAGASCAKAADDNDDFADSLSKVAVAAEKATRSKFFSGLGFASNPEEKEKLITEAKTLQGLLVESTANATAEQYKDIVKKNATEAKRVGEGLALSGLDKGLSDFFLGIAAEGDAIVKTEKDIKKETKDTASEAKRQASEIANLRDKILSNAGSISARDAQAQLKAFQAAAQGFAVDGRATGAVAEKMAIAFDKFRREAAEAGIPLVGLNADLRALSDVTAIYVKDVGDVGPALKDADQTALELAKSNSVLGTAMREMATDAGEVGPPFSAMTGQARIATEANKKLRETTDQVADGFGNLVAALVSGKGAGSAFSSLVGDAIGGLNSKLKEAFKGSGFKGIGDSLKGIFSSGGLKDIGGSLLSGLATGGLTAGINAAIGLVGKLFDKPPAWKRNVQDVIKRNLGVSLSQGASEAILNIKNEVGGKVSNAMRQTLGLDIILKEATVGAGNVAKFTSEFSKLSAAAQGVGQEADYARAHVGPAYDELRQKMSEAGLAGTAEMHQLNEEAKELAKTVPSIAASFKASLVGAGGDLDKLFSFIGTKQGADLLGSTGGLSADLLTGLRSIPGAAKDVLGSLGAGLDALEKQAKKAGTALPEGVAGLLGEKHFYDANKGLLDAIDATASFAQKLGDIGFVSQQGFGALETQAGLFVDKLAKAGKVGPEALGLMAPLLQQIVNASQREEYEIDANTKGYIDQAAALGLLKLAGTDAAAATRAETDYTLRGFAAIFGKEGAINRYIDETAKAVKTATADVVGGTVDMANAAADGAQRAAGAAAGAIDRLRKAAGSTIDNLTTGAGETFIQKWIKEHETHAGGGLVGPEGGIAGEGEVVMRREAVRAIGAQRLVRANRQATSGALAGAGGGGGDVHLNVNLVLPDGTVLAHAAQILKGAVRAVGDALTNGEITVPVNRVSQRRR